MDIAIDTGIADPDAAIAASPDGVVVLDPFASVIVAAGISTEDGEEFYEGSERRILSILDQRFAVLEPGIITTWNGSILDLPLLRARARALDLGLGLRIRPDRRRTLRSVGSLGGSRALRPTLQVGRTPSGGVRPVAGAWHRQRHLDLRWVYGEPATPGDLRGPDPCRGAHLARSLAERRSSRARRHLDRVPPPTPMTSYAWACLSPEADAGPTVSVLDAARRRHPSAGAALQP